MKTASDIIEALGGSAKISRETGIAYTTVASWRASNFIPEWRQGKLLELALEGKKPISASDFPAKSSRTRQAAKVT